MGAEKADRRSPTFAQRHLLLVLVFTAACPVLAAQDAGVAQPPIPPWRRPFYGIIDSFDSVEAERFVSNDGRRYVVVDERDGERRAELMQRHPQAQGAAAIRYDLSRTLEGGAKEPLRGDQDQSLLDVLLPGGSCEILVPERLVGFACFVGSTLGDAWHLRWIGSKGEQSFSISIDKHMQRSAWGDPSLSARVRGAWIDEGRAEIVLLSPPDVRGQTVVCVVAIADGSLRKGCSADERLRWAMFGAESSRRLALELIGNSTVAECRRAMALVGSVAFDPDVSPLLRLHAAWIVARGGRPEQAAPVFRAAIDPAMAAPTDTAPDFAHSGPSEAEQCCGFALRHLFDALGDAAAPLLRVAIRHKSWHWHTDLLEGWLAVGPAAAPVLRALLGDADAGELARHRAILVLHALGDASAVPELLAVAQEGHGTLANAAIDAAFEIGGTATRARLFDLLQAGGAGSFAIATFLQGRPQSDALPALNAALARCNEPTLREALEGAKKVCERTRH